MGSSEPAHSSTDADAKLGILVREIQEYAVFLVDTDGAITTWNAGAAQIYGYAFEDVRGRSMALLYPPEDVTSEKAQREMSLAANQGKFEDEGWRVRKDGSRFWASVLCTAIRNSAGALVGYGKVVRDLTRVHQSTQLLRSVLDNTLDAIITIDARGTIQSFNAAGERMFGYSEGEVTGRNVKTLMPEPYRAEHDGYLNNYLTTGKARIIGIGREVQAKRRDGTVFPIDLAVTKFTLEGQLVFTGIIRDLSAHKRLEEQLRQSQKMEAMGQLAGGIAHDFNNLLTVIGGYCEGLEISMRPDDPSIEPIRQIASAAERAATLTGQLLAFSRKAVFEPKVLDLNIIIAETGKMLRRTIGENISLTIALANEPSWVRIDPGQVNQVLLNLAVNARDAMPFGGSLTIRTSSTAVDPPMAQALAISAGDFVRLEVFDTGCGMSEEVRRRIFEPFFTTKGPGRGTGLGLATVYGIVRQSGGAVDVTSVEGRGSSFEVLLPLVDAPERQPSKTGTDTIPRGHETVLLVEDDPQVRQIVSDMLKDIGYKVIAAGSAEEGLAVAGRADPAPDIVITDVIMPGQSGRFLAEQLMSVMPQVKVLFISGYTDDDVLRQGVQQSEMAFIQKPFTRQTLARKLREVLDR